MATPSKIVNKIIGMHTKYLPISDYIDVDNLVKEIQQEVLDVGLNSLSKQFIIHMIDKRIKGIEKARIKSVSKINKVYDDISDASDNDVNMLLTYVALSSETLFRNINGISLYTSKYVRPISVWLKDKCSNYTDFEDQLYRIDKLCPELLSQEKDQHGYRVWGFRHIGQPATVNQAQSIRFNNKLADIYYEIHPAEVT